MLMITFQSTAPLDKIDCRMASWPARQMPAERATLPAVARTAVEPTWTLAGATQSLHGALNAKNAKE